MREKFNAGNMVTNRLLNGIMCKSTCGKPIIHLTLRGLKCSLGICKVYVLCRGFTLLFVYVMIQNSVKCVFDSFEDRDGTCAVKTLMKLIQENHVEKLGDPFYEESA